MLYEQCCANRPPSRPPTDNLPDTLARSFACQANSVCDGDRNSRLWQLANGCGSDIGFAVQARAALRKQLRLKQDTCASNIDDTSIEKAATPVGLIGG